jgi:hypothetical protein
MTWFAACLAHGARSVGVFLAGVVAIGCDPEPVSCRPGSTLLDVGDCSGFWDLCDDGSNFFVSCSNHTFDGRYACTCSAGLLGGHTFQADRICELELESFTDQAIEGCGWNMVIAE